VGGWVGGWVFVYYIICIYIIYYIYILYYIYTLTASPLCRASPNGAGSEGSEVEEGDSWVHGDVPGSVGLKSRPAQTSISFRKGNVCMCASVRPSVRVCARNEME
jgi:hypothetical protein